MHNACTCVRERKTGAGDRDLKNSHDANIRIYTRRISAASRMPHGLLESEGRKERKRRTSDFRPRLYARRQMDMCVGGALCAILYIYLLILSIYTRWGSKRERGRKGHLARERESTRITDF